MKTLTVLLVDDDSDDADLFKEILADAAPSTAFLWAKDGQDALLKLGSSALLPDLNILDLNNPRMRGKECLSILKKDELLHRIPVIMYTTSSLSKDIEECMLLGAECFITKPSNSKELNYILFSIIDSMPHNLKKALTHLSNNSTTFIVC